MSYRQLDDTVAESESGKGSTLPWPTKTADPLHASTNADTANVNMRGYVANDTPARSAPNSGSNPAGDVPKNSMDARLEALDDRRGTGNYPRPGGEDSTNTTASGATPLPYGLQPREEGNRDGDDILTQISFRQKDGR